MSLWMLTVLLVVAAPERTPLMVPGGVVVHVDPALPFAPPSSAAEDPPLSLAELAAGERAWLSYAAARGEPFGIPARLHRQGGAELSHDVLAWVLERVNRLFPTGLLPAPKTGLPIGVVEDAAAGQVLTQSCAVCHTGRVNGHVIPGVANKFYNQKLMFQSSRVLLTAASRAARMELGLPLASGAEIDAQLARLKRYEALQNDGCEKDLSPGVVTGVRIWHVSSGTLTDTRQLETAQGRAQFPCGVVKIPPTNNLRFRNLFFWDGSINTSWPVRWPVLDFLGVSRVEAWQEAVADPQMRALEKFMIFGTRSPSWEEVMETPLDQQRADRGFTRFHAPASCASCHGTHDAGGMLTAYVPQVTPLDVVRTDPERVDAVSTTVLAAFSRVPGAHLPGSAGERIQGYVAAPLCSPFLHYPYLHTGAVPTLHELLLPEANRSRIHYLGETIERVNVGYFTPATFPRGILGGPARSNFMHRKVPQRLLAGHSGERFGTTLNDDGRRELLEYLKTLRCPPAVEK